MSSAPRSVLVSVRPALLGSLLARLIESETVPVTVMHPVPASLQAAQFTVAVTSDPLPQSVRASTVIRLPDPDRQRQAGYIHRNGDDVIVRISTPEDVVALVKQLLDG